MSKFILSLLLFFQVAAFRSIIAADLNVEDIDIKFGKTEKVFDWSSDKCTKRDIFDAPANPFIDNQGQVQLPVPFPENRRFVGPNIDQLNKECRIILDSKHRSQSRLYDDVQWITSPYTEDGKNIYSIAHNEYHGWEHDNCNSSNLSNCWWNAINLVYSTDGGRNYQYASPPNHNVANSPVDYDPNNTQGAVGYFEPSNIIKKDGYYYFLALQHHPPDPYGTVVMRTDDLTDPDSWRCWDGQGFNTSPDGHKCAKLEGAIPHYYLSYNDYLDTYIAFQCHWQWGCGYRFLMI